MRKYLYKFLRLLLVVATCIVALFVTSSKIGAQGIDISEIRQIHKLCPTPERVIADWYGTHPNIPNSFGVYAVLPFPTIPGIGNCLDIDKNGVHSWCACTGADCFNESANNHLKMQLLWDTDIPHSKRWRTTFTPPIPKNDIHLAESTCYRNLGNPNCPANKGKYWENPTYKRFPPGGNFIDAIEWDMPPRGCVFPETQICAWDFTIANKKYHEHFATNEDCYGWIEVMVIP